MKGKIEVRSSTHIRLTLKIVISLPSFGLNIMNNTALMMTKAFRSGRSSIVTPETKAFGYSRQVMY